MNSTMELEGILRSLYFMNCYTPMISTSVVMNQLPAEIQKMKEGSMI